jgi:hypothetical protein
MCIHVGDYKRLRGENGTRLVHVAAILISDWQVHDYGYLMLLDGTPHFSLSNIHCVFLAGGLAVA